LNEDYVQISVGIKEKQRHSVKHFIRFALFALMLCVLSCDTEEDTSRPDSDSEYLPLSKGFYQIYDVEEIRYTLGVPETLKYELKVAVTDSFVNGTGKYTYVLHRTRKVEMDGSWEPIETWSAEVRNHEAIVTQGSTPYVVMAFPAIANRAWNGNAYNNEGNPVTGEKEDVYMITGKGSTETVNGSTFNDCINILQEDNQEFIVYLDQRSEVYARNVGLISKMITQLKYCNDADRNCIGQQIIDEGIIYKQLIREYGRE
jgi:hypothetical protein